MFCFLISIKSKIELLGSTNKISLIIDSIGVIPLPAAKIHKILILLFKFSKNRPPGGKTDNRSPIFNCRFINVLNFPLCTSLTATHHLCSDGAEQIE